MLVETGGGRDRKILIIHDDLDALNECKKDLDGCEDFQILNADPQAGKDLILNDPDLDAVICAIKIASAGGLEFLNAVRSMNIHLPVIMVLSQSEKTDFFRDSIRLGVIDFVERPFQSLQILDSTKRAAEIGFSTRKLLTDLSEAAPNSFQKFNELAFFRYLMNQLPLTFGK